MMKSFLSLFLVLVLATAANAAEIKAGQATLIEEHDQEQRRLCSPAIRPLKNYYACGEQIVAITTVCGSAVEWMGIYPVNAGIRSNSPNWQYMTGSQTVPGPAPFGPNTYGYGFTGHSGQFPLAGGVYKFYYHASGISAASPAFTLGSCGGGGGYVPPVSSTGTNAPRVRFLREGGEE
eukprot:CAMPEP_0113623784 /NCGR_PEP_ID=MMETSP0017_2-20120614/12245_1 /TAXON_ID=2856 /ORGANISM="Cylindrotheca closterium" /LENGTH=177 /DNA_ID=CAMNT_0000533763 /DNA_START=111 /DNA_END=644 /DNA_ORIENTATION=- /assembly_acc=CAM_ASM_000147